MSEVSMEDLAQRGEDALDHAGVKGMKWGVRKTESTSSAPAAPKPPKKPKMTTSNVVRAVALTAAGARVTRALLETQPYGNATKSDIDVAAEIAASKATAGSEAYNSLPPTRSGGMFNPDAKLDTSRMRDDGGDGDMIMNIEDRWNWDW